MNIFRNKGFTLIELMIVVVIVGIIAGFAVPSYTKSIRKSHERDVILQLSSLHSANLIYRAHQDEYWDTAGVATSNLTTINTTLGINIISNNGSSYTYNSADGSGFVAKATWDDFTLEIDEGAIDGNNPCCAASTAGLCPSRADC